MRAPSRKLEPIVDGNKLVPKPSVSPDLSMTIDVQNPQVLNNNVQGSTKVSPFGQNQAQTLAASHSIAMANQASKTLDLGNTPANARNINVQSVMAESSKMMDGGLQPLQVNLRKTLYN